MSETTGTPKSKPELMQVFRDGQPVDSITAQDMRDYIESVIIPALIDGMKNVETGSWAGWTKNSNYLTSAGVRLNGGSPIEETHPGILAEALTGEVDVPSSTDFSGASIGVAGRARTASLAHGAVGVYGSGMPYTGAGPNTAVWGANFLANNQNIPIGGVFGIEIDLNIDGTTAEDAPALAIGCVISGSSVREPTEGSVAFVVWPLSGVPPNSSGTPCRWTNAFESVSGAAEVGLKLWQKTPTPESASQEIVLVSSTSGLPATARIFSTANGNVVIYAGGSIGGAFAFINNFGQVDAQGGFAVNGANGLTGPIQIRNAAGDGTRTLTFTGGILTGNTTP